MAIAIFVNAAKGISALQLGRDLDVSYKTAFVLAHKLREAMAADQAQLPARAATSRSTAATSAGTSGRRTTRADRKDRRLAEHQTGKRRVVVVMRERQGRTLPFVVQVGGRGGADRRPPRAAGLDRLRRRGRALGCPARPVRDAPDQPRLRVHRRRRLHQPSGELLQPAAPGRVRAAPPHQRASTCRSTPGRWRGARTCGARTPATSTSAAAQLVRVLAAAHGLRF